VIGAPTGCQACTAGIIWLASCFTVDMLARLSRGRRPHAYKRGQQIYHEGTPALAVYCVHTGRVGLVRSGPHEHDVVVGVRAAGDLFGAREVLAQVPYGATAEVYEPALVCAIPAPVFLELIDEHPPLARRLLKRLAAESLSSEQSLSARTQECVVQRTARFVINLLSPCAPTDGRVERARLSLSREEMAHRIGTSPETLSRTLHRLANLGVFELVGRREIQVRNRSALERIAR
jgi:CRP-like cAMP-binding protein